MATLGSDGALTLSHMEQGDTATLGSVQATADQAEKPTTATTEVKRTRIAIDMDSHNGLRGAAAIWIVVFHCLQYSKLGLNWQGSTLMPLFFCLSGFSLAVTYASKPIAFKRASLSAVSATDDPATTMPKPFDYWAFFQNRLARVMGGYYFGFALALPLWFFGYGFMPQNQPLQLYLSIALSIIPVITLVSPVAGLYAFPIDSPEWTICTLLAMWAVFPFFAAHGQKLSDTGLTRAIVVCYWVQCALVFILQFTLQNTIIGWWAAFATATMNPISRLPVFLMGVYAGLLALRYPGTGHIPWPSTWFGFPLPSCARLERSKHKTEEGWGSMANWFSIWLLVCTLVVGAGDTCLKVLTGGGDLGGNVWLQAIVPQAQLNVILAVTRDGGTSLTSRALRTKLAQWLGLYSMAIYIVHFPLMFYLAWAVNGKTNPPPSSWTCFGVDDKEACQEAVGDFMMGQLMPGWGVFVVLPVTMLVAVASYHYVEEPTRKYFRAKKN